MTSAFQGDYKDGDIVQCQRCAKNVRVKYYDRDTVVIVSTQEQQTLALRCQYCGYVMCDSCAHPAESLFPVCPSCQREWGPYYFTHDVVSPSLTKAAVSGNVPPPSKPKIAHETEVNDVFLPGKDVPLSTTETLAAGEVDLFRDELDRKHKNLIRRLLTIGLILILMGIVAFAAFSRGGSLLRKGLGILSARPTRASTAIGTQKNNLDLASTSKTVTPNQLLSTTSSRSSPTPIIPTITKLANKTGTTSSSTRIAATATPTIIPTSTDTLFPSSTSTTPAQGDCIPALSVTLNDVGKVLCVTGTVVYTTQKGDAFSIYFSIDEGTFRIVVYDRVPTGIKDGVCVKVTGVIKELLNGPVIAPGYKDVIEICSQ